MQPMPMDKKNPQYEKPSYEELERRCSMQADELVRLKSITDLLDSALDGIYLLDADLNFLEINLQALAIYGLARNDVIGRNLAEVWPHAVRSGRYEKYREVIRTGTAIAFENAFTHPSLGGRHYLLKAFKVGSGLGIIAADITERKRAEKLYRTLAESCHAGVYIVQDGTIRFVNPYMLAYSGYSEDELLGADIWNFVHPEDRERGRADAISMLRGERSTPYEYRFIGSSGQSIWIMETVRPITYEGNRAVLGNTMDVTERHHMEDRIRQAVKMEAIATLAGGIAHEFNNILSAVMGYTEMARDDAGATPRIRGYLDQVYAAGERARELVKQILLFSRQSEDKPRPLRIGPMIKEVLKLVRASVPSTITIKHDIRTDGDLVCADPMHIHQITLNLCTNAAQSMRDGKGTIGVSLSPVEIDRQAAAALSQDVMPGRYIRLSITDTGPGIDAGVIDRIFEPFFTTKNVGEGAGLGLSVVHGIVTGYGGTVTVESEAGRGSAFTVYLPLLADAARIRKDTFDVRLRKGKGRLLFVDDEEVIVRLAKEMLTALGYDVVGTTESMEALNIFCREPDRFDLVITDMTMPELTGTELTREVIALRPDMPVLLCTGISETIKWDEAIAAGVREVILKPFTLTAMAAAIAKSLNP